LDLHPAPAREQRIRMARNRQPRKPVESAVEMAVAAVEDNPLPSPLDQDMAGIGEPPSDLDLTLPGKPDNRHAAETRAIRGRPKERF
jgi:hypothetical protein